MKVKPINDIQQAYKENLKVALNKLKKRVNQIVKTACSKNSCCCGVDITISIQPAQVVTYEIKYTHYALKEAEVEKINSKA